MGKARRASKRQCQDERWCEVSIYKRGEVYWYKFMWQGRMVRESTKQGNDKVARQMEAAHRTSLAKGEVGIREKRPVPISKLEQIVNEAESFVIESAERERKTSELGELIMNRLRRYDKVAYVRFASVYLDFKDVKEFMNELKDLVKAKTPGVG